MHVTLIRRLRRWPAIGAGLCVALLAVSCSVISPERPYQPEQHTLRVAATSSIDSVPLRLGVKRGVFAAEGLDVQVVDSATDDEVLRAVLDGSADVGLASNYVMLRRAAGGARFELQGEAYACGPDTMALVALPGRDYEAPTRRPKPVIGIAPGHPFGKLATRLRLATEGVDPERITFVEMRYAEQISALRSGRIDAAWMTEPDISKAQKEYGAEVVMDTARGALLDFPLSSYVAAHDHARQQPEVYAAFRRALVKAQELATNGAVVRAELSELTGVDPTTAQLVALGTFPTSLNEVRLQRAADLFYRAGVVSERVDVASMLPQQDGVGAVA